MQQPDHPAAKPARTKGRPRDASQISLSKRKGPPRAHPSWRVWRSWRLVPRLPTAWKGSSPLATPVAPASRSSRTGPPPETSPATEARAYRGAGVPTQAGVWRRV